MRGTFECVRRLWKYQHTPVDILQLVRTVPLHNEILCKENEMLKDARRKRTISTLNAKAATCEPINKKKTVARAIKKR